MEAFKICTKCGVSLPITLFYRRSDKHSDQPRSVCKSCSYTQWKERYKATYCARIKKWSSAVRREGIVAYGGKCACCGESREQFLAFDHINGGGNQHRKKNRIGKIQFWLKRQGWPKEGFRLLCHNCNSARGFYGACPHETERPQYIDSSFLLYS